jgi:hypothetical protein
MLVPRTSCPRLVYRSALPDSCLRHSVLWLRLTPVLSIQSCDWGCGYPQDDRSPQVRTLTFPAHPPNLLLCPLMDWTSWYLAHSSERTASYQVRVPQVAGLPPASSGPHLTVTPLPLATVSSINLRKILHLLVNAHAGRTRLPAAARAAACRRGLRSPPSANRGG